jgi:hypothetical protein
MDKKICGGGFNLITGHGFYRPGNAGDYMNILSFVRFSQGC